MKKSFCAILLSTAALFAVAEDGFMSEHWNQTSPWNDYMPSYLPAAEHADTGMESYKYRAPAGCVATAMAQVLDYWQWPKRYLTIPRHSHNHSVGVEDKYAFTLSITFDGHAEFKFDGSAADMARLTYMCASLGNLAFNRSGTGGVPSTVAGNLSDYYEFEKDASWDRIKELLSNGYPIPATIDGHAIVLHGWRETKENGVEVYKNNGYSGSGDEWIPIKQVLTTTVCYPKKKAFFEPMQKSYGPNPTISWSFPKRYETVCKDEFGGFKISVYGKGEKTPFKTYDVAATVRSFTFTELTAGSYTIEIAPIFGGKVLADQADSKPLVITDSEVKPLTMVLSSKDVTTAFKPVSFTATCASAVKEVNVFPNITEFRQEATKGQEYAYCYLVDGFKSSLNGNVATITIDPTTFPRRLKGQNLILTVQAVDAQENEVYEDVIVRLIEEGTVPTEPEGSGTGSETEGTDPGTGGGEGEEGTDPDPGTEDDPTNYVTDSDGADYILISPADFVVPWTEYVKARAKAHPELKFAVKNAAEIYAAYKDLNPSEKIKEYIKSKVPDGKGTKYFVLGGAWVDGSSTADPLGVALAPGEGEEKASYMRLTLDNTIPGWVTSVGSLGSLPNDYEYALIDDDMKPDVVIARIPVTPWAVGKDGKIPTFSEIIEGYGNKVAAVEAEDYAGRHRYACAGGHLGPGGDKPWEVYKSSSLYPTERHHYCDGYLDFFDPKHPDPASDGEIAARRRFRDYFAMYNPIKGAMVIPEGNPAADLFSYDWEAIIVKSHGEVYESSNTGLTTALYEASTHLVKFNIFAMPCLTGTPDGTGSYDRFKGLKCPSLGEAAIMNPYGGSVVGYHNTRKAPGLNEQDRVVVFKDGYATDMEGFILDALCKERTNAGEAWLEAHQKYSSRTGDYNVWCLRESILYGDPLIKLSEINKGEKVCGPGAVPAKVLFR